MATEEDVEDGPWRAGAIGRIPDDDALVWRDDAVYGAQFYAATPTEAEGAARLLNDLEARTTRYRTALEKLRDLMNPTNREQFVMRGPMAFVSVYNVVEDALK